MTLRLAPLAVALVFASAAAAAPVLVETRDYAMAKESGAVALAVDPAAGGPVWIALQHIGALARLDPSTGAVQQIPLGAGSAPNGVVLAPDGAPWVTDGGQNLLLRVDPRTQAVKTWALPEAAGYVELSAAAFDGKGRLWFTGQAGVYGCLDPSGGDMRVWDAPKGAGPAAIVATPSGRLAYLSIAGGHVGLIEPGTGAAETIEPSPWQGPRRLAVDSRGRIYVTEWNLGRLSRYDPTAKSWKTWPLPGSRSRGFAVHVDGQEAVWIGDWGINALHRFDPEAERFQTFGYSQPNANVRQIGGRGNEIWTAESGIDRVVLRRFR